MGTPQGAMEGDKKLRAIRTVRNEVTGKQGEPQTGVLPIALLYRPPADWETVHVLWSVVYVYIHTVC